MTLIVTLAPAQGRSINARRPRHHTYLCTAGGACSGVVPGGCPRIDFSEKRQRWPSIPLLAVFPALAALISLFGLVADPAAVAERLRTLAATLPVGAAEMVSDELRSVAARTGGHLGLGAGLAAAALWSAMAAAGQLFGALNIIYCEQENRSFLRFNLTALLFAFGAAGFILLSLGAIAAM